MQRIHPSSNLCTLLKIMTGKLLMKLINHHPMRDMNKNTTFCLLNVSLLLIYLQNNNFFSQPTFYYICFTTSIDKNFKNTTDSIPFPHKLIVNVYINCSRSLSVETSSSEDNNKFTAIFTHIKSIAIPNFFVGFNAISPLIPECNLKICICLLPAEKKSFLSDE